MKRLFYWLKKTFVIRIQSGGPQKVDPPPVPRWGKGITEDILKAQLVQNERLNKKYDR